MAISAKIFESSVVNFTIVLRDTLFTYKVMKKYNIQPKSRIECGKYRSLRWLFHLKILILQSNCPELLSGSGNENYKHTI